MVCLGFYMRQLMHEVESYSKIHRRRECDFSDPIKVELAELLLKDFLIIKIIINCVKREFMCLFKLIQWMKFLVCYNHTLIFIQRFIGFNNREDHTRHMILNQFNLTAAYEIYLINKFDFKKLRNFKSIINNGKVFLP